MSRRFCLALGTKLPDNHSCGDPCATFPLCLPPSSDAAELERERARFLDELHNAIAEVKKGKWTSAKRG
jgi:hypothetical protein